MSGLPRDLLKWLQSLDLSYSIRNVRRDFSNGFLAAEIFSRYFKNDIQMHSYDNGTSTLKKKDNWEQLMKFFMRMGYPITQHLIDDVMNCKENAASVLLETIYTILTQKTLAARPVAEPLEQAPAFARPTASQLVRDTLKQASSTLPQDISVSLHKAQNVIEQHNQSNKQERLQDPSRFQPLKRSATSSKMIRVPTRQVNASEEVPPQIQFIKEVNVKSVDENIAQLRATKSMASVGSRSSAQSAAGNNPDFPVHVVSSSSGFNAHAKPVMHLLSSCVLSKLEGTDAVKLFDPRQDAIVGFVEAIAQLSDDVSSDVLNFLIEKAASICADSCLASPKEFWTFFSLFVPALSHLHHSSKSFQATCQLLGVVGERMVSKDQYVPFALFCDFALPKLCTLLKSQPRKLPILSRLIYSYAVPDVEEHVKAIRRVQEALEDASTFVHVLSVLISSEREFNEKLLDLYTYYCMIGMRHASPLLRSASLHMLSILAPHDHEHKFVLTIFNRMTELVADEWWEVRAQLLVASSALLRVIGEDHPRCQELYQLIESILLSDTQTNVQKIGLSAISSNLASHPYLLRSFVSSLLVNHEARHSLLSGKSDIPLVIPSSCRSEYRLTPLPVTWYSLGIAQTIASHVRDGGLGNMGAERIELLAAALVNMPSFAANEIDQWKTVFDDLKDYILVELCDEKICDLVVLILKKFLFDPSLSAEAMQIMLPTPQGTVPPLFGILKFVYAAAKNGDVAPSQIAVHHFLSELARQPSFTPHIVSLLKNFAEKESAIFNASVSLKELLSSLPNAVASSAVPNRR